MSQLFRRNILFEAGAADKVDANQFIANDQPETFHISFDGELSVEPEPNIMEVQIFNLNRKSRTAIENAERARLSFGYADAGVKKIFEGDIAMVRSDHSGVDWITSVTIADAGRALKYGRVNETFPPGTTYAEYFATVCQSFNIASGVVVPLTFCGKNTAIFAASMVQGTGTPENCQYYGNKQKKKKKPKKTMFANGLTISKPARKVLEDLCNTHGLLFFIHDNMLFILPEDDSGIITGLMWEETDAESGMLGYPSKLEDGGVSVRAFIDPRFSPGGGVTVWSKQDDLTLSYRISHITIVGSNFENDCYMEMETFAP